MKKGLLYSVLILTLSLSFSGCGIIITQEISTNTESSALVQESSGSSQSSEEISAEDVSPTPFEESETTKPEISHESSSAESSEISKSSYIPFPEQSENSIPSADISLVEDFDKKYFVKRLNSEMLYYFCKLYNAARNYESDVYFDRALDENEMNTLMYLLNYDCPELIHLSGDYYPHYDINEPEKYHGVGFIFCIPKEEYKSSAEQLNQYFSVLKNDLNGKSDYEKEKYVYDKIYYNCIYDETLPHSGSAYGTLIENFGRCEALSKSFAWCMRKLDIECLTVSGFPLWNPNSVYSEHSWNIVKIDGDWYHVDITTDNVQLTTLRDNLPNYGFFNASDSMINGNRLIKEIYINLGIPVCSSDKLNYHVLNNQLLVSDRTDEEHFDSIMSSHMTDDGIKALSVRFENKADYEYACDNIEVWTKNFLDSNSDKAFIFNTYYNKLSYTIVTDVRFTDNAEG